MTRCKKITILICVLLTALNIVACGQVKKDEVVNESIDVEESNAQASENIDSEMTAEELLDLFINGSISAISSTDLTSAFYITDLNMDSEEWDSILLERKLTLTMMEKMN